MTQMLKWKERVQDEGNEGARGGPRWLALRRFATSSALPDRISRRFVIVIVVLAFLLYLPSISIGYYLDDYLGLAAVEGVSPMMNGPFDLYRAASGVPADVTRYIESGSLPWWTYPGLRYALWRPLGSVLFTLDHALFGLNAALAHVHSLVWYLASIACAAAVMRAALPTLMAGLALALFAFDSTHAVAVAYLMNRHVLLGTVFGLLGVLAHFRWQAFGWRLGGVLAPVAFIAACASGEVALQAMAYVLAFEMVKRARPWRDRLFALLPSVLVASVYLAVYSALGRGMRGSAHYFDPLHEPHRFFARLPARILAIAGRELTPVGSFLPGRWLSLVVVVAFAAALCVAWLRARTSESASRWLIAGGALGLLPMAASDDVERTLMLPSLGGAVAVALVVLEGGRAMMRARSLLLRGLLGAATVALAFLHLGIGPVVTMERFRGMASATKSDVQKLAAVTPQCSGTRDVLLLNTERPTIGLSARSILRFELGQPSPPWWTLAMTKRPLEVIRTGLESVDLVVSHGRLLTSYGEDVFRDPVYYPMRAGETVVLKTMNIHLDDVTKGCPTRVSVQFNRDLDAPDVCILVPRANGLQRIHLPPLGGVLKIPAQT